MPKSSTITLITWNNIPPSNIFNYDETNVTDDPGAQMVNSFIFTTIGLGSLHLRLFKFR